MIRLRMLKSLVAEHGSRSGKGGLHGSCPPGPMALLARCSRSTTWLSASAADNRQVSGNDLLLQVAAVHGIAACSHSSLHHRTSSGASRVHQQPPQHVHSAPVPSPNIVMGNAGSSLQFTDSKAPQMCAGHVLQPYAAGNRLQPATRHQQQLLHAPLGSGQPCCSKHRLAGHTVLAAHATPAVYGGLGGLNSQQVLGRVVCSPRHQAVFAAYAASRSGERQYAAASGDTSGFSEGWRRKRPVEMTPAEKHQVLLEKLEDAWAPYGGSPSHGLDTGRDVVCPACGNGSKSEKAFHVTINEDNILWCCHRATCGFQGGVSVFGGQNVSGDDVARVAGAIEEADRMGQRAVLDVNNTDIAQWHQQQRQLMQHTTPRGPLEQDFEPLSVEFLKWFEGRKISERTLKRNRIRMKTCYNSAHNQKDVQHIAFPFYKNGVVVNVKYRALLGENKKVFQQSAGGQQIFYGYDDAKGADEIIIVEGEMDKLAIEEALFNAVDLHYSQPQQQHVDASDTNRESDDASTTSSSSSSTGSSSGGTLGGAAGLQPPWWPLGRRIAVLSVPAGAKAGSSGKKNKSGNSPPRSTRTTEKQFTFLEDARDLLMSARRVLIAVDNDEPGHALAAELVRRIGKERCWTVKFPSGAASSYAPLADVAAVKIKDAAKAGVPAPAAVKLSSLVPGINETQLLALHEAGVLDTSAGGSPDVVSLSLNPDVWKRKDANEVLMKDGWQVLLKYIDAAEPIPIRGLFKFQDFWSEVYDLYQQGPKGLSWGLSTGWHTVDTCYKVVPGELTIVTGLPNSGKSEWLDALTVNLARMHGMRFAMCSMENSAKDHGRKLMEKYTGKPFFSAAYSHGAARMDRTELIDAMLWLDEHFHIIRAPAHSLPTIDYILDKARAAILRYGIRGLVIDPYNELDHRRATTFSETEHVSRLLTKVKRFAQHFEIHVWFVAHPRTQRGLGSGGGVATLPAPTMYDISGSANFINKADNGIVIHRPYTSGQDGQDPFAVQVLVRKVRNKLAGKIGDVLLRYDKVTGCYVDDMVQNS